MRSIQAGLLALLVSWSASFARADAPTSHHSVTISATVTEEGKNGEENGHTTVVITNRAILKEVIAQPGNGSLKPSELDIVEEDESGAVDVIVRTTHQVLYTFGEALNANETTTFSTTENFGFYQYRVLNNYAIDLLFEGHTAYVNIAFTNTLDAGADFKQSKASFVGGPATDATFQFLIRGELVTGRRQYVY